MAHDTAKDPRLLVAELAQRRLSRILPLRQGVRPGLSKQQTTEHLRRIESQIQVCKYMYLEPEELAGQQPLGAIVESAAALGQSLAGALEHRETSPSLRAELRWGLQILEGLQRRLRRPGSSLAAGVDLLVVRVRNVTAKGSLWITRVTDGTRELTVVTNMAGIEPGQVLAAALLPPVQLAGTVSEAMFLSREGRSEPPGTLLTDQDADVREASAILYEACGLS